MENEDEDIVDDIKFNNSSAVNNSILHYYKKFGKKRDIEQFFSLSTAQSELKDPTSLFWRRMKGQNDSSDSGDKNSESSTELCRVSIRCSVPEPPSLQKNNQKPLSDSESPPIVSEENMLRSNINSEDDNIKSDGENSRKSVDATLDSSINRPHSPTSSITSQRKLEWDSLADVGYANESDRKNSASSLSTLERLALQQQYSNNDTKQNSVIGNPTAHSTPVDQNESKLKGNKEILKKTTKIYKKDVDFVEVTVPQFSENKLQPINVNLTKHISFNVERDGEIKIDNISKNFTLSPEKVLETDEKTAQEKLDKEIQTTLPKKQNKSINSMEFPDNTFSKQKFPVLISLSSLRKRNRKKKVRKLTRHSKMTVTSQKQNIQHEKSGVLLSDAESFEYMPGHMFNQKQERNNIPTDMNMADNKSSLESSAGHTTESSKGSQQSFSKDLEKSIDLLKTALKHRYDDSSLKKKLIKEVVQRLMKSKYRDDESATGFLSGLNFKKVEYNQTTSSTSDNNVSCNKAKLSKPKKSILRNDDTFSPNPIAATSQSAPNLPSITNSDKPFKSNLTKLLNTSSTDSNVSRHSKHVSDIKTSSEELYKQYLEALKKEEDYRKHLKSKEIFLRQKLGSSEAILNVVKQNEIRSQNRLKDLISDLSRNNYDDGSGDASKLEYGSSSNIDLDKYSIKKHRNHSVFTLSSANSESQCKNTKIRDRLQNEIHNSLTENNKTKKYCCCSSRTAHGRVSVTDSSVQVNLKCEKSSLDKNGNQHSKPEELCKGVSNKRAKNKNPTNDKPQSPESTDDIKYVCLCADNAVSSQDMPENILIYKCSRLPNKCFMIGNNLTEVSSSKVQNACDTDLLPHNKLSASNGSNCDDKCLIIKDSFSNTPSSKSSQTNLNLPLILHCKSSERSVATSAEDKNFLKDDAISKPEDTSKVVKYVQEATRWIQTEISIDPKISDPSLTDIKIVSDENSVKLAGIQNREISQPCSDNNVNKQLGEHKNFLCKDSLSKRTPNTTVKDNLTLLDVVINQQDKEIQSCCNESQNSVATQTIHNIESCCTQSDINLSHKKEIYSCLVESNNKSAPQSLHKEDSDNFTIPIQGTNMTLKVSLGSGDKPISRNYTPAENLNVKNISHSSKAVETMKSKVVENYTCLQEECSKGVQSDNIDIITQFNTKIIPRGIDRDMNTEEAVTRKNKVKSNSFPSQSYNDYTSVTTNCNRNTYPKPNNVQKPLLRSQTDYGGIRNFCHSTYSKKNADTQHDNLLSTQKTLKGISIDQEKRNTLNSDKCCSTGYTDNSEKSKISTESSKHSKLKKSNAESDCCTGKDQLLDMIQDITKKYSKKNIEKSKRKKCFKEIITVLNYLLDTEDSAENDLNVISSSSASDEGVNATGKLPQSKQCCDNVPVKTFEDKSVQLSTRKSKSNRTCTESSDLPVSTDIPSTSDSATCKVLNKIKKECEKYHQKRCKSHSGIKKCEPSSSTSVNCDQCKRVHYCFCRNHRCKNHKPKSHEKIKKNCVAYNLIIQTSDSFLSEEINEEKCTRQLKNIIVKVPSKRKVEKLQFKEMVSKLEKDNLCRGKSCRSRSLPNDSEISSTDDFVKKAQMYTVREYLEKNRPDFVDNSSKRQNCLKLINESSPTDCETPRLKMVVVHTPNCMGNNNMGSCNMVCGGVPMNTCKQGVDPYNNVRCIQSEVTKIANERAAKRQLLSLQMDQQPTVASVSETELRRLAEHFGKKIRTKKVAPKFLSEKEMKQHSEKIYKTLPEVQRKKEEAKKENIKKTNLLMANIFKKNLQKKTLRGAVNLSNYSAVIKI